MVGDFKISNNFFRYKFIHLLRFPPKIELAALRQLNSKDFYLIPCEIFQLKTAKLSCARSMYWFSILPQNSSAVNERTNIFQSSRIIFALCNTFAVCLFKKILSCSVFKLKFLYCIFTFFTSVHNCKLNLPQNS